MPASAIGTAETLASESSTSREARHMTLPLLVVFVVTGAALFGGLAYTLRYFKGSAKGDAAAAPDDHHPSEAAHAAISPHDHATTELLKRFFDGKDCAICKRPIPPVHRTGLRPGLFNPATHQTHPWDEIPNVNLSTVLENELPVCSACQVAESFRERFPDLVVDRERAERSEPRKASVAE
jgi:hypothetical protein